MKSPLAKAASLSISLAAFLLLLPASARGQEQERKAEFETIAKSFACGHAGKTNYVVTTREEWEKVWSAAHANAYPIPPAPEVDFAGRSIIAVFQGDQPSSGYDISVTKLVRSGKKLKVHVREVSPDLPCKVLLVITQPFQIILTEKIDHPEKVKFKTKQELKLCE
ncbi:MAG TPA: protease complex subunit PrcB family protein [Blastocatellia bacterium]|nr:protease complex subunit PrcB family protein [Blastocatellia bacterium]